MEEFYNLPLTDFSQSENRQAMTSAIDCVRSQLGRTHDIIIGTKRIRSPEQFQSLNPSRKNEVVGSFQKGTVDLVNEAILVADGAFERWSRTSVEERVEYLLRLSRIVRARRLELAAWMVLEVGKSWVEADADVAEAVDFFEFYSREMLRLATPRPLVEIDSEENTLDYIALGVGVIIPPWNFPLAILGGMAFAAVVAGNTVVMKPSSDSPAIASVLMDIVQETGFPPGVVNLLTGSGGEIGDALVKHPRTRFVSFTGSKEVGLRINELAAVPQPGQIWIKRVVAEMGGKDSIVVDSESDLDAASAGVTAAAFGYQGQKCSACSRAIVVEPVYDEFLEKLQEKTQNTIVEGDVEQSGVNFGPVINQRAMESIQGHIEVGKKEGRLVMGGEAGSSEGYFIHPTIIADLPPNSTMAQEEIFGPALAVIKAHDFDDALEIANNTQFGLTGSVYTENRAKIDKARSEFHVGNFYINRKCTGAMVGVHPFGGFNMSGTDSKAGGPDYLLLFTQAKTVSEKVS
ncbi:MAG: L-glutamate gamma-semialdehyde dehydrogenase [Acidobacteriota bacterium]